MTRFVTHIDSAGRPVGRLRLHRTYKSVVKAARYKGGGPWAEVEDFHPDDIDHEDLLGPSWEPDTASATQPPPGQRVAYLRVSSTGQNVARQREAVGAVDAEFIDRVSGSTRTGRTELARAMDYLRAGDTLIVASIDRLARSTTDLHRIVEEIQTKGAGVEFVKEALRFSPDATDPRDQLMLTVMGAIAAFERDLIRERQAEGIAAAKARGAYRGAPRAMDDEMVAEARRRIAAGETKTAVARDLGVGRMTLYRYLDTK